MKKKLTLVFAIAIMAMCVFALSVFANGIYSDYTQSGANGESPIFKHFCYSAHTYSANSYHMYVFIIF